MELSERRSAKWAVHGPDVLPAWVAEMDFPLAEPVADVLQRAIARGDTGYAAPNTSRLANAFSGFAARRIGWSVDPAQVRVIADVHIALLEVFRALLEPGDRIVVNTPAYPPYFDIVEEVGCVLDEVPLAQDGSLDPDAVDAAFSQRGAKALLLCSPQNPTGDVPARQTLQRIAESAREHGAWVVADEIHAPLVLPGATHVAFDELAPTHTVTVTSASKAFNLPGLKCGLIVTADERAYDAMERGLPTDLHYRTGHLGVLAAEAAFEDGDGWLDATIRTLDGNRALIADELSRHEQLRPVRYTPPAASFLAWLDCRALGLGDDPAKTFLDKGRVALSPGPDFGTPGHGHARLNFGTTPALVREAIARMARALD